MEIIATLADQVAPSSSEGSQDLEMQARNKKKRKIKFRIFVLLISAILITSFFECLYLFTSDLTAEERKKFFEFFQTNNLTAFHTPCQTELGEEGDRQF